MDRSGVLVPAGAVIRVGVIVCFTKAIELDPKLANACYNRGVAYGEKVEFDAAIEDYTKAIERQPRFAAA